MGYTASTIIQVGPKVMSQRLGGKDYLDFVTIWPTCGCHGQMDVDHDNGQNFKIA